MKMKTKTADLFKPGWYTVRINSAETFTSQNGKSSYLQYSAIISDDPYAGRIISDTIILYHPNSTVQKIGQRQLSELAKACSIANPSDSSDFIGKRLIIRVGLKPAGHRGSYNEVDQYKAANLPAPVKKRSKPKVSVEWGAMPLLRKFHSWHTHFRARR